MINCAAASLETSHVRGSKRSHVEVAGVLFLEEVCF